MSFDKAELTAIKKTIMWFAFNLVDMGMATLIDGFPHCL